ncbi:MAG: DUF6206 family protein [Dehalococcoidia bacterium]|nr:DUF6206 family protein [Dehalococcoidia bacterium]MDD5494373.1 DUF6206 family protein [Dehalococcoidia bacterium]
MYIDIELLKQFEKGLDPEHPENSLIPASVLGYGEISTIFEIESESTCGLACKRLPIFRTGDEAARYEQLYNAYNHTLEKAIGISVPSYGFTSFKTDEGRIIAFDIQEKLPANSIGNRVIHALNTENIRALFLLILSELSKIWEFNRLNPDRALGIDGQISNWSIVNLYSLGANITPDTRLVYFDTSTPLMKRGGVEQLDPELFLRSAPSFLVWIIRWLFLKDVMTRYYDARLVTIDLIANFYKEQKPEIVPLLVEAANEFYSRDDILLAIKPITEKEVRSYYKEDALIWTLFLAFRRIDRWLHKYILHRPYIYILPGNIKR